MLNYGISYECTAFFTRRGVRETPLSSRGVPRQARSPLTIPPLPQVP